MVFETWLNPEDAVRYRRAGLWGDETLYELVSRRAAAHPQREAIVGSSHRVSYRELKQHVDRVASGLAALGIGRGDVVAIQLPNWVEFAYVFCALGRIGAVANQIGPDYRSAEVEYILRFSESRAWIGPARFKDFDYLGMVRSLRSAVPSLRHLIALGGERAPDVVSFADLLSGEGEAATSPGAPAGPDDVMRMTFTSGTTGNPKGVLHSFNSSAWTCRQFNADMQVTADEVFLIYLPLGLNWGSQTLLQSLLAGAKAVLLDRFSARAALDLIERERVSFIPTAPASIVSMLDNPDFARRDLSSLRVVVTGGATCPLDVIRRFRARSSAHLVDVYGMLETGFHTYTRLTDDPEIVNGTVGRVQPGMGLRLLDENLRDVPPETEGEIAAAGPAVHLGYHRNPAVNAEQFTADGWFRSGDLGTIDSSGNLRIVGRLKEVINRGGKKFFPREVEEILYTHPKVLHAAIIGLPDPRLGERNCLCVIPRPGDAPTLEEMKSFLKDRVAVYKLPEMLEVFEDFPFTPTGKVQRRILAMRVLERRGAISHAGGGQPSV
jgi:non-ribosomal peptide synthetase component E (peptide arylation enzyme)